MPKATQWVTQAGRLEDFPSHPPRETSGFLRPSLTVAVSAQGEVPILSHAGWREHVKRLLGSSAPRPRERRKPRTWGAPPSTGYINCGVRCSKSMKKFQDSDSRASNQARAPCDGTGHLPLRLVLAPATEAPAGASEDREKTGLC